jgi:hypothetical protein
MATTRALPQIPASAEADLEYVRSWFRPLDGSLMPLVDAGLLPAPTYVMPDGTPMVPPDHAQLLEDAGGDPDAIAEIFRNRYLAAGGSADLAEAEYEAWLSGQYGACLRSTSPEAIVAKDGLMSAIGALLSKPLPEDDQWAAALRHAVDALDVLERPFAEYDRVRFGSPTSRDRLITATRERFPQLWR